MSIHNNGKHMRIFANCALLQHGFVENVALEITDGIISKIIENADHKGATTTVDTLLPAVANLHSHSFQRAMSGMTEYRERGRESFWTWRELMYAFLDHLTPEHISAIAAQTFMEMQLAGYAAVSEFHYVHHKQGGGHYDNIAELTERIFEAAALTGIGLTHLPVLYSQAGPGGEALAGGQLRFQNDIDAFLSIVNESQRLATSLTPDAGVGIAPHSLRAVSRTSLKEVLAQSTSGPVHIHIAEQTKEVEDITVAFGSRPVSWLMDNVEVDDRWCLIHATHMTADETQRVAQSGAVAGLCPITEANLGDGIFDGGRYMECDGVFGIGSDSNVNISLTEELRLLEYSQRLRDRQRNVLSGKIGHTGHHLYTGAAQGGAQALSRNAGQIAVGMLADLVAIDRDDPRLCGLENDKLLDGLVFAANDTVVTDVWSAGRHQVRAGRHVKQGEVTQQFRSAMKDLVARLT